MAQSKKTPEASGVKVYCAHDKVVDITTIVPNPRNPNKHPDNQIELLAKIIMNQGWRNAITVSTRSGFIVRGHGRYEAAKQMQVDEVPIDFQDYASDAEEWADLIADNRIAELSKMDSAGLKDLLNEIDTGDFDMDLTGFDHNSLENLMTHDGYFDANDPDAEWEGMPEWGQEDTRPHRSIIVHLKDEQAVEDFKKLVGQDFSDGAKWIFWPDVDIDHVRGERWVSEDELPEDYDPDAEGSEEEEETADDADDQEE